MPHLRPAGSDPKKKSISACERDQAQRETFQTYQAQLDITKLIVLDECATHTSLALLYGWAPRGQRAYAQVPRNRGPNLTGLAALSLEGLVSNRAVVFEGAMDKLTFETYVEQFLAPTLQPEQVVIMDNLAAHKSHQVEAAITGRGCEILYLPAYSPDFSPIELAFSKFKLYLRQVGARHHSTLIEAITSGLALITPQDALGYFKHCGYPLLDQPFCN